MPMITNILLVVALAAAFVALLVAWRATRALRRSVSDFSDGDFEGGVRATTRPPPVLVERLMGALQASDDGTVIVDADGTVVMRNAAAARFHNARHADALAEQVIDELLESARHGDPGERELQLYGPPRESLLVRAVPLRRRAVVVGAVAFVRDMSEARRIESVRHDFVANVSHELKTPIGALSVLAETLAEGGDPVVMRRLAERVLGEAERLGNIVDDLLDLSLIEAQESPERDTVTVVHLLSEAIERVKPAADVRGIPIEVADVRSDLAIACDRPRVVSALINLLDNAVKYSDAGAPVELSASHQNNRLVIIVRDHGIGIPTRDLERIFERFYRVDRARSRQTGGTGLGLSIVRHVAQAHGGEVSVESREGEGSTFRFVLPDGPAAPFRTVAEVS